MINITVFKEMINITKTWERDKLKYEKEINGKLKTKQKIKILN